MFKNLEKKELFENLVVEVLVKPVIEKIAGETLDIRSHFVAATKKEFL